MVLINLISDIHLEYLSRYPNLINNDYENTILCLLGDIGYPSSKLYKDFIGHCSKTFKMVLVILGNHELYKSSMSDVKYKLKYLPNNVHLLDNSYIIINGIKFIGSILWSDIDPSIAYYINDYRYINFDSTRKLTVNDTLGFFKESKEYILQEIKSDLNIKCVLLTHHGVHSICNGKYIDNEISSAFASNIPELYLQKNLVACLNGHTHQNLCTVIPGTDIKLLSNCVGYKSEHLDYSLSKIFEL